MYHYQFYIGSLAIDLTSRIDIELDRYDRFFFSSILPTSDNMRVHIHLLDTAEYAAFNQSTGISDISLQADGFFYLSPDSELAKLEVHRSRIAWQDDSYEYRLYQEQGQWITVSRSLKAEETIKHISHNTSCDIVETDITPHTATGSSISDIPTVDIYFTLPSWKKISYNYRPWGMMHIEEYMLGNHALVLHSASIICQDQAILFTAPSGTGKSTHADLWHKIYPNIRDINGDRTTLQYDGQNWLACGFPIFGSSYICEQLACPIRAIIILEQCPHNYIEQLSSIQKISLLYSQITVPSFSEICVDTAMQYIEELISQIEVIRYHCNMEEEASTLLHDYLFK